MFFGQDSDLDVDVLDELGCGPSRALLSIPMSCSSSQSSLSQVSFGQKKKKKKIIIPSFIQNDVRHERNESAREQRIALYKSDQ